MKIALFQMNIAWEDKEANFKKLETAVSKVIEQGVRALFLPEMSFTGFSMNISLTAESDYYTVKKVSDICKKYKLAIGFGWVEKYGDKAKNCYTVLDENGSELSTYTKIHPFSYASEDDYFVKGDKTVRFNIESTELSCVICYDLRFPELFQAISKNENISAIVVPANWPAKRAEHWHTLLKARAIENQVYIIGVNCTGDIDKIKYTGGSCVINPNGEVEAIADDSEVLLYATLDYDIKALRDSFPVKKDRQTGLYKGLL
ncbi:MAG: carbon-nitrogen family hydrolase [Acutalibacteraceae bacterium]|nr:carbon-nitrogen family hydrolase [Acutalibacteraceae bacterium]